MLVHRQFYNLFFSKSFVPAHLPTMSPSCHNFERVATNKSKRRIHVTYRHRSRGLEKFNILNCKFRKITGAESSSAITTARPKQWNGGARIESPPQLYINRQRVRYHYCWVIIMQYTRYPFTVFN